MMTVVTLILIIASIATPTEGLSHQPSASVLKAES
jgi:hypothetical protein